MEGILREKTFTQRPFIEDKGNNQDKKVSCISPNSQHGIGVHQIFTKKALSAQGHRSSPNLVSANFSLNHGEKRTNPEANVPSHEYADTQEEKHPKILKHQPKISNNLLLPAIFTNEKSSALKIK